MALWLPDDFRLCREDALKAPDFEYEKPDTLAAALALLASPGRDTQPLAGGQSLAPMMNFRLAQPEVLVDLNGIAELKGIREDNDRIVIGAMTRYADLEHSPLIDRHAPLLKMAVPHIAHAAIRNRGTIGGSVALADPAAEMPGVLLALDATVITTSANGERQTRADDFFLGLYETALDEGEIVKAVSMSKAQAGSRFAFYELARRHGDYAMAGVALAASDTAPCSGLRIAFFGVSDCALRATDAEDALNGRSLGDVDAVAMALGALDRIEFHADLNASAVTKRHLAGVVLERALAELGS